MAASPTVWQIAGGPLNRSYVDCFLKHGVGLIGPGDPGPWSSERDHEEYKRGSIRQFAQDVRMGDTFVLRTGRSGVAAVGLVASEYMHLPQCDDVNGWDLQHARRVRWSSPLKDQFATPVFGANPPPFSRVNVGEVVDYATRFINSPPSNWQAAPLPGLPPEEPELTELPEALQYFVGSVQDLALLMGDRQRFGDAPLESELVAHLVVPFLRALGWPQERIALEWRNIDVAVFDALPRSPRSCRFIIEAKRLGLGLERVLEDQASGYARSLETRCDIVVTDGIRYRLYSAQDDYVPVAYANLSRLKQKASELFARLKCP